jgi:hypothetical protein
MMLTNLQEMIDVMKKKSGYTMTDKDEGTTATKMKAKKAHASTGAMKKSAKYEKSSPKKSRS